MRYSDIYKERLTQTLTNNIQRETENHTIFIPNNFNNREEDYIPRETLNSVYGDNYDIIQSNLSEVEKVK